MLNRQQILSHFKYEVIPNQLMLLEFSAKYHFGKSHSYGLIFVVFLEKFVIFRNFTKEDTKKMVIETYVVENLKRSAALLYRELYEQCQQQ